MKSTREHFRNAISNYGGVMDILAQWEEEEIPHNNNAPVPENWKEGPLLLLSEYLEMLTWMIEKRKCTARPH
jgi:hypothetical protein